MFNRIILLAILLVTSVSFSYGQTDRPVIYVPYNLGIPRISIIDAQTLTEIDSISLEGTQPGGVILRPDRKVAFVSNDSLFDTGVLIVDLLHRSFKKVLPGNKVSGLKIGTNGKLYILLADIKQLVVMNAQSYEIEGLINLPYSPASIEFYPNSNRAIVLTGIMESFSHSDLVEVDLDTLKITRTIDNFPIGYLFGNYQVAISPDGAFAYVGVSGKVVVVDTRSFSMIAPLPGTAFTQNVLINPDGKTLYAIDANFLLGEPRLLQIDLVSGKIRNEINFKASSYRYIALSPDSRMLYVNSDHLLFSIDTTSFSIVGFYESIQSGFGGEIALDGNFNIGTAPNVKFIAPIENEILQKGKTYTVKWEFEAGSATIPTNTFLLNPQQLELSLDGGPFITIAQKLSPSVKQFDYSAPLVPTFSTAQFRISVNDVFGRKAVKIVTFRVGDAVTTPTDTQAPTVKFLSPLGNEIFNSGSTINITWSSSDNVGVISQDLSLSTDGGSSFPITLASGLAGATQNFSYSIPAMLQTSTARLRLAVRDAAGNTAQAITTSNFQIQNVPPPDTQAPTVKISSPSGNAFAAGESISVNWQSIDDIGVTSQELLLSLDGSTFQSVSVFDGNTASFVLTNIPGLDKTVSIAQVKITATDASGNKGEQAASFLVAPFINQASFSKPTLTITGNGFTSSAASSNLSVTINGKVVSATSIMTSSNTSITLRGNKKKLGVVKGNNKITVSVNGVLSNIGSFIF